MKWQGIVARNTKFVITGERGIKFITLKTLARPYGQYRLEAW